MPEPMPEYDKNWLKKIIQLCDLGGSWGRIHFTVQIHLPAIVNLMPSLVLHFNVYENK